MNTAHENSNATSEPRARVLVVEDKFLVAIQLEDDLKAAGYAVVGPFTDLESAMQASRKEEFDVAILDANLNGTMSFPPADELNERSLTKPCDVDTLLAEIERAVETPTGR